MNLIIVLHEHEYGSPSTYLIKTPLYPKDFPKDEDLAKILKIDFEPEKGEELTCSVVHHNEVDEYDHRWHPVKPEPVDDILYLDDPNSPENLQYKYDCTDDGSWGEHPDWPMSEWQNDAGNGDTRLGYWEWVAHNLEVADE